MYDLVMSKSEQKIAFSKRLIEICGDKGLPAHGRQQALGKLCNLKQQSVSKWFNAESVPEYENAVILCNYFNVNFEWLMLGTGSKLKTEQKIEDSDFYSSVGRTKETMSVAEWERVKEFLKGTPQQQIKAISVIKEEETGRSEKTGAGPENKQH